MNTMKGIKKHDASKVQESMLALNLKEPKQIRIKLLLFYCGIRKCRYLHFPRWVRLVENAAFFFWHITTACWEDKKTSFHSFFFFFVQLSENSVIIQIQECRLRAIHKDLSNCHIRKSFQNNKKKAPTCGQSHMRLHEPPCTDHSEKTKQFSRLPIHIYPPMHSARSQLQSDIIPLEQAGQNSCWFSGKSGLLS